MKNPTTLMPAGKYYIGDLCYVMHPQWDEFCEITIKEHTCYDGQFQLANGVRFATFGTAYGDGFYYDQQGNGYGVDAGLIGCIKIEDIADPEADIEGGNIVEFEQPFEVGTYDGIIYFGDIKIDTDPKYYEEDSDSSY